VTQCNVNNGTWSIWFNEYKKSITYVVWIESVTENSTVSCHS